jgi:hypothetical protein
MRKVTTKQDQLEKESNEDKDDNEVTYTYKERLVYDIEKKQWIIDTVKVYD